MRAGLARRTSAQIEDLRREVDRLRGLVARKDRRIAQLRARQRGRDDLGYLFVVTYGRSGSTLVNGVLNSIPGYLLRGENGDALRHLFRFHTTMVDRRARHGPQTKRPTRPWFGIGDFDADRSLEELRRLATTVVMRPRPDTRVTGFKEIRWAAADLPAYVAWLQQVFPGARFVVNTRDHDGVLASGWWAEGDTEAKARRLKAAEEQLLEVARGLGEDAFRVHYDEYVADPGVLRGLFDWLGEEYDDARVRAVFDQAHSY